MVTETSSSSSSPAQKKKEDAESKKQRQEEEEEEAELASSPPGQDEFVSDAFGESGLSEEEIRREMEQQMLGGASPGKDGELRDWKKDLEEKLLEQQVLALAEVGDAGCHGDDDLESEEWEKEIMEEIMEMKD
ncbi:synapse-associated protein 1 [Elysia marginata]|uniref:Synapse-associated protein 1 n=1 Tax=Elysia marginata TaxID=1093978 RepID=A0AAV4IFJ0_9GAST|nr:synapse-associated protein 1 [Elysia marginata]